MLKFYLEFKQAVVWELFWFTKKAKYLDSYNRIEGQLRALEFGQ